MVWADIDRKNRLYLAVVILLFVLAEWVDRVDWSWIVSFSSLGGL